MPVLAEIYSEYKDKGVNIIGIASDAYDDMAFANKALKEKGVNYTNIIPERDSKYKTEHIDKIMGFPYTVFVDNEGKIRGAGLSGGSKEKLLNRINSILEKE